MALPILIAHVAARMAPVAAPLVRTVQHFASKALAPKPAQLAHLEASSIVKSSAHMGALQHPAAATAPATAIAVGTAMLSTTSTWHHGPSASTRTLSESIAHLDQIAQAMPRLDPVGGITQLAMQALAPETRAGRAAEQGFRSYRPDPKSVVLPGSLPPPRELGEIFPATPPGKEVRLPGKIPVLADTRPQGFAPHTPSADDHLLLRKQEPVVTPSTVIIGASGAFAPALAAEAQRRHPDAPVYVTSRNPAPAPEFRLPGVQYIETRNGLSDITPDFLDTLKPQYVFNLANTSGPSFEAAFDVNVARRLRVIHAVDAYSQNVDWSVAHPILSSHSVFKYGRELNETSLPDTLSNYGGTTYMSELLRNAPLSKVGALENENFDIPVLRLPTLVGVPFSTPFVPERATRLQFNNWVKQAATEGRIAVDGPPGVLRPYGFAPDIAAQAFNIMTHPDPAVRNGLFVLGRPGPGGQALSTEDAVKMVVNTAKAVDGKVVNYHFTGNQQRLGDRDITVDTSAYHRLFPDHQATSLESVLVDLYSKYQKQYNK